MPKHRIISRANYYDPLGRRYYAQVKLFGLWIDCRFIPFYYDLEYRSFGLPTSSRITNVEKFLDAKLHGLAKQIDWEEHVEKEFD